MYLIKNAWYVMIGFGGCLILLSLSASDIVAKGSTDFIVALLAPLIAVWGALLIAKKTAYSYFFIQQRKWKDGSFVIDKFREDAYFLWNIHGRIAAIIGQIGFITNPKNPPSLRSRLLKERVSTINFDDKALLLNIKLDPKIIGWATAFVSHYSVLQKNIFHTIDECSDKKITFEEFRKFIGDALVDTMMHRRDFNRIGSLIMQLYDKAINAKKVNFYEDDVFIRMQKDIIEEYNIVKEKYEELSRIDKFFK